MNTFFRYVICALTIIIFFSHTASHAADSRACTKDDAYQAESEASTVDGWRALYASFKRFEHCDDAAISEGYSDSVGRLLSKHWDQIAQFDSLAKKDHAFKLFVIRHIDDTVSVDDLKAIEHNAKTRCPPGARRLCKLIADAARSP